MHRTLHLLLFSIIPLESHFPSYSCYIINRCWSRIKHVCSWQLEVAKCKPPRAVQGLVFWHCTKVSCWHMISLRWEGISKGHLIPLLSPRRSWQSRLLRASRRSILRISAGGGCCSLPGQPAHSGVWPFSQQKINYYVKSEFLMFHFIFTASCPSTLHLWEESGSIFSALLPR